MHVKWAIWIHPQLKMWFGSWHRARNVEKSSLRGKSRCHLFQKPVVIASCLHKEYAGQKKSCFSKRKKKIAARNISFCVKKGLEGSLFKFTIILRNTRRTSVTVTLCLLKRSFIHSTCIFLSVLGTVLESGNVMKQIGTFLTSWVFHPKGVDKQKYPKKRSFRCHTGRFKYAKWHECLRAAFTSG